MSDSTFENEESHASQQGYVFQRSEEAARFFSERSADKEGAFFLPHLRSGMDLLDCGCGAGSITIGLSRVVAPGHTVGIDINSSQIRMAREQASRVTMPNLRFEVADLYHLPFPDGSFDAIFSNAVLEHLAGPMAALQEMRRVMKKDGIIGLRCLDADGLLVYPPVPPGATVLETPRKVDRTERRESLHRQTFKKVAAQRRLSRRPANRDL